MQLGGDRLDQYLSYCHPNGQQQSCHTSPGAGPAPNYKPGGRRDAYRHQRSFQNGFADFSAFLAEFFDSIAGFISALAFHCFLSAFRCMVGRAFITTLVRWIFPDMFSVSPTLGMSFRRPNVLV
jgi:hypothetical protein